MNTKYAIYTASLFDDTLLIYNILFFNTEMYFVFKQNKKNWY